MGGPPDPAKQQTWARYNNLKLWALVQQIEGELDEAPRNPLVDYVFRELFADAPSVRPTAR